MTYRSRTFHLGLFSLLLLGWLAGVVTLVLRLESLGPSAIYYGLGGGVVVLLLVIAVGQSAASFTISDEGFAVTSQNYLLRIKRSRLIAWSEIASAEHVNVGHHTSHTGSDIGGHYMVVHLRDGSNVRVVGSRADYDGAQLRHFHAALLQRIGSPRPA